MVTVIIIFYLHNHGNNGKESEKQLFMWNKKDLQLQGLQMRMQMLQGRNMHLRRKMHMLLQVWIKKS